MIRLTKLSNAAPSLARVLQAQNCKNNPITFSQRLGHFRSKSLTGSMLAWLSALFVLGGASVPMADAEEEAQMREPRPCVGYAPDSEIWGMGRSEFFEKMFCAPGYAVMGISTPIVTNRELGLSILSGLDCCPLPDGVLTTASVFEEGRCPPDTVVTGHYLIVPEGGSGSKDLLRCTKVDTRRYRLSTPLPGKSWGRVENTAAETILGARQIDRSRGQLPVSLRYGVGRISKTEWETNGCTGAEPGALFVGRSGTACGDLQFAELVHADRGQNKPVEVLPDCAAIDDIFSKTARCIGGDRP